MTFRKIILTLTIQNWLINVLSLLQHQLSTSVKLGVLHRFTIVVVDCVIKRGSYSMTVVQTILECVYFLDGHVRRTDVESISFYYGHVRRPVSNAFNSTTITCDDRCRKLLILRRFSQNRCRILFFGYFCYFCCIWFWLLCILSF